jgi:hypothetical protein
LDQLGGLWCPQWASPEYGLSLGHSLFIDLCGAKIGQHLTVKSGQESYSSTIDHTLNLSRRNDGDTAQREVQA